jgi:hypothetical protein
VKLSGIALGYGLDEWGFESWQGLGIFHHHVQTSSGAHPASYPMGTRGPFLGGKKWLGCEADNSPPSSTEVKECVYLHSPHMPSWHGAQLKKAQGQLYLLPML